MTTLAQIEVETGHDGGIRCTVCREYFADGSVEDILADATLHVELCPGPPPFREPSQIQTIQDQIILAAWGDQVRASLTNPHPILGKLK